MTGLDGVLVGLIFTVFILAASVISHLQGFKKGYFAAIAAVGRESKDSNVEAVRTKLNTRAMVGLMKYGVTTERDDLTNSEWLTHLQEELLDASVYIESIKSHGDRK